MEAYPPLSADYADAKARQAHERVDALEREVAQLRVALIQLRNQVAGPPFSQQMRSEEFNATWALADLPADFTPTPEADRVYGTEAGPPCPNPGCREDLAPLTGGHYWCSLCNEEFTTEYLARQGVGLPVETSLSSGFVAELQRQGIIDGPTQRYRSPRRPWWKFW